MGVHRCERPATSALSTVRLPSPANYPDAASPRGSPACSRSRRSWYPTDIPRLSERCRAGTCSCTSFSRGNAITFARGKRMCRVASEGTILQKISSTTGCEYLRILREELNQSALYPNLFLCVPAHSWLRICVLHSLPAVVRYLCSPTPYCLGLQAGHSLKYSIPRYNNLRSNCAGSPPLLTLGSCDQSASAHRCR